MPSRTFPRWSDILGNVATLGESMSTRNRTMTFRMTARDNRAGGGGVDWAATTVTVNAAAGPFLVTSPNTAVSWAGNSSQTVTWNVAGTDAAPVSCANVAIDLSIDGGTTFPTILAASTANDGSESVDRAEHGRRPRRACASPASATSSSTSAMPTSRSPAWWWSCPSRTDSRAAPRGLVGRHALTGRARRGARVGASPPSELLPRASPGRARQRRVRPSTAAR